MIDEIVKGDAVDFVCNIGENIVGWTLRAELWDEDDNVVEKGNTAAGGDDTQISIDDADNGIFTIHMLTGDTANMNDLANLEVEAEVIGKKYTILKDAVSLVRKRIDWSVPSQYPPN
jgi:hypothetical protein